MNTIKTATLDLSCQYELKRAVSVYKKMFGSQPEWSNAYRKHTGLELEYFTTEVDGGIAGFAIGHNITANQQSIDFLKFEKEVSSSHYSQEGDLFYLAEVRVLGCYQEQEIGTELVRRILQKKSQRRILVIEDDRSATYCLTENMERQSYMRASRHKIIMILSPFV